MDRIERGEGGNAKKADSNNYDDDDDAAWAGEIDAADFPKGSWQTDSAYVASFLAQSKALVRGVQTSIYNEYGWTKEEYPNGAVLYPENDDDRQLQPKGGKSVAWMYDGTWSKKIKRSFVEKYGTQEDIARLPPVTARNRSHLSKRPIQVNKRRLTNKVRKKGQTRKGSIHEQVEDEFDEFEDIN